MPGRWPKNPSTLTPRQQMTLAGPTIAIDGQRHLSEPAPRFETLAKHDFDARQHALHRRGREPKPAKAGSHAVITLASLAIRV